MTNMMHKFFSMYLFLFKTLYMFGACEMCAGWEKTFFQPAHILATNIEWLLPEAVLIQFVSPDDEHDVLETCREF